METEHEKNGLPGLLNHLILMWIFLSTSSGVPYSHTEHDNPVTQLVLLRRVQNVDRCLSCYNDNNIYKVDMPEGVYMHTDTMAHCKGNVEPKGLQCFVLDHLVRNFFRG